MSDALLLFLSAFLAATLVPVSSEAVLAWLARADGAELVLLIAVATLGNTLGAVVNAVLGRWLRRYRRSRWFPVKPRALARATLWMRRRGQWLLLFAWLPVVGDPLTFAAGVLRVRWVPFLILVTIGKCARYVVVVLAARAL